MGRRALGVGLTAGLLLVLLAAFRLQSPGIAGSAQLAPVAGAPLVGECLTATAGLTRDGEWTVPAGRFGRCDAPHYGEVLAVDEQGWVPGGTAATSSIWPMPPCSSAQPGLTADGTLVVDGSSVAWIPLTLAIPQVMVPDQAQQAAGQRWLLCVLSPIGTLEEAPWQGRISGVHQGVTVDDDLFVCTSVVVEPTVATPCSEPHAIEIFGTTIDLPPGTTEAQLDRDCLALVRSQMADEDPTRGGELSVTAVPWVWPEGGDPVRKLSSGPESSAHCLVQATGDRRLIGTLRGIDSGPLPWAS